MAQLHSRTCEGSKRDVKLLFKYCNTGKKNNEQIPNQQQNCIFITVHAGRFYDFIDFYFQLF